MLAEEGEIKMKKQTLGLIFGVLCIIGGLGAFFKPYVWHKYSAGECLVIPSAMMILEIKDTAFRKYEYQAYMLFMAFPPTSMELRKFEANLPKDVDVYSCEELKQAAAE